MEFMHGLQIGISLLQTISQSQKWLFLVSPYLKPWDELLNSIIDASHRRVAVTLVLRGAEMRAENEKLSKPLADRGVTIKFLDRLHAKLYVNESQAVVTSMNLHRESLLDSWEAAVVLNGQKDRDGYEQVLNSLRELTTKVEAQEKRLAPCRLESSPKVSRNVSPSPVPQNKTSGKNLEHPPRGRADIRMQGACIRCCTPISLNPERPFCRACFASWAEFENADYQEKHCHRCGTTSLTSMARPLCRGCWVKLNG